MEFQEPWNPSKLMGQLIQKSPGNSRAEYGVLLGFGAADLAPDLTPDLAQDIALDLALAVGDNLAPGPRSRTDEVPGREQAHDGGRGRQGRFVGRGRREKDACLFLCVHRGGGQWRVKKRGPGSTCACTRNYTTIRRALAVLRYVPRKEPFLA